MNNTHLAHFEDLIFIQGSNGITNILTILEDFESLFTAGISQSNITRKWDGAPAIVCGIHPDTDRFFVSTKSFFNKVPKINYTVKDVHENHENPGLRTRLSDGLAYLPALKMEGIWQGDMLYTVTDLYKKHDYICFKPNVVEYKIPLATDLARRISESAIGIIFHTTYQNLTEASYNVPIGQLTPSRWVWYRDASLVNSIGAPAFFTEQEYSKYKKLSDAIKKDAIKLSDARSQNTLQTLMVKESIKDLTQRYINDNIRQGHNHFTFADLDQFIFWKLTDHIAEAKTNAAKDNRIKKRTEIREFLHDNTPVWQRLFSMFNNVIAAKKVIMEKLDQMKDIETDQVIHEGYVVSDKGSNAVKLVDRTVFSYQNFNLEKEW